MPQDLIPANLPIYYRCLALPVNWEAGVTARKKEQSGLVPLSAMVRATQAAPDMDLLRVTHVAGREPTFFDPKQKRNEFFRLRRGDTGQLVSFLSTVGLFESEASLFNVAWVAEYDEGLKKAITKTLGGDFHSVPYHPLHSAKKIWDIRDALVRWLKGSKELGEVCDFSARIVRESKSPKVVITTATLLDALLLSITIDRVKKSKVQKCARPDCGILFTPDTRHKKKYCSRSCAHVESVRKSRRKKPTKASEKGR